jgi:hypothetical protein
MNNDPLARRLNEMSAPAPSESARARAKHRALVAFQQGPSHDAPPERKGTHAAGWFGLGVVTALVAILLVIPFRPQPVATENVASDRQMLRQMEALFSHQLDSVVEENGKIELSVGTSAMVGADQPIVVVFRKDGQAIRVLSFSGHHVCVAMGQDHRCFDLMATASGGVILVTGNEVLTAQAHGGLSVAGYSVQAQTLEASL